MWVAATVSQPPASAAGTDGAPEGEEDLLGDVLGLIAGAEHARGDGDDARVVAAEDLLEVGPDARPGPAACDAPFSPGRAALDQPGAARPGAMPHEFHIRTAPPAPGCDTEGNFIGA